MSDRPRGHLALGAGNEFDAIRALLDRWGQRAHDVGDDAATLDVPAGRHLIASTDTSVENVHFRREWLSPEEIGWRAVTSALSDLAAMGATPLAVLTALVVPPSWRDSLAALGDGIGAAAAAVGAPIAGGDISTGTELSIGVTVLGSAVTPLPRAGARPGDLLWVTGALGGPAAALRSWLAGDAPSPESRARFARPEARVPHGEWFAAAGATAAIDISDGLVADAAHIAAASGVDLTIALERIPLFRGASPDDAAASGEEYELLVAAPASLDARAFAGRFDLTLTRIGEVLSASDGPQVIVTSGGARVDIARGHDHFSR